MLKWYVVHITVIGVVSDVLATVYRFILVTRQGKKE